MIPTILARLIPTARNDDSSGIMQQNATADSGAPNLLPKSCCVDNFVIRIGVTAERQKFMSLPETLHGYHVHIYFDDETKAQATELHDALVDKFKAEPSRPAFIGIAGPHPIAQMAAIFPKAAFTADVVPWLMFNRQGLDLLIYPLTDDEVDDHTEHAVWLGKPVELLIEKLNHGPTIWELMPTS